MKYCSQSDHQQWLMYFFIHLTREAVAGWSRYSAAKVMQSAYIYILKDGHHIARVVDHLAPGHDRVLVLILVLGCTHSNLSIASAVLRPLIDIRRAEKDIFIVHDHQLGMHLRFQVAAFSCTMACPWDPDSCLQECVLPPYLRTLLASLSLRTSTRVT